MKKHVFECKKCGTQNVIEPGLLSTIRIDLEQEYKKREQELLERTRTDVQQQFYLKLLEKDTLIHSLKEQLTKVQNKLDNSSMQLIGEVQEIFLESFLAENFSTDQVIPVGKGVRGADCTLHVRTTTSVEIGTILFESKRVKSFSEGWIDKLKADNLKAKCSVMVIVTSVMPKDIPGKIGIKNGVWICQFEPEAIRQLTMVLRFGLLKLYEISQTHKLGNSAAEKLYQFLTSQDFKEQFENILKGFQVLEDSFQQERKKLTSLWKIREQQLKQMLDSTLEFYGSLRGISSAIPAIETLGLPQAD